MDNQQMKEWQSHNDLLQRYYNAYLSAYKQQEKDSLLIKIQNELNWRPFMNYCCDSTAPFYSISKYGLDSVTEQCINEIDMIAKREMELIY